MGEIVKRAIAQAAAKRIASSLFHASNAGKPRLWSAARARIPAGGGLLAWRARCGRNSWSLRKIL